MERKGSRARATSIILLVGMIGSGCGPLDPATGPDGATPRASGGASSPGAAIDPDLKVQVPEPPAAAQPAAGDPDAIAAELAAAVGDGGQDGLAPLLAAYAASGIPVIGADGAPLPGFEEDPLGPPWWLVWMSAGTNPGFRFSLADAARLSIAMEGAPGLDPDALGVALLDDLRAMAAAPDPRQRVFARFLAARATTMGPDPLDAQVGATDIRLDGISVAFLYAGFLRSAVIGLVAADPTAYPVASAHIASTEKGVLDRVVLLADAPASNPCNPSGTGEQISYWTQWIASKIAGGIQLPGMQGATKSAIEMVIKDASAAGRAGKAAAWAGAAINALTFLIQLASIEAEIDLDPIPLERTKTTSPGKVSTLIATIRYDLKDTGLDGGEGIKNCLLVFLNSLGIQTSLSSDGAIGKATVVFEGGQGFPSVSGDQAFVRFAEAGKLTQTADDNGVARIRLEGMPQKREVPDGAGEWPRPASVRIKATVEAENERSIVNTFVDSVLGVTQRGAALVAPIVDVLKTFRYDLGEKVFLVLDWRLGWLIDDSSAFGKEYGKKCDGVGGEWTIEGDNNLPGIKATHRYTITIDEDSLTGRFKYEEISEITGGGGSAVNILNRSGTVKLRIDASGIAVMDLMDQAATLTTSIQGQTQTADLPLDTDKLVWDSAGEACPPDG